MFTLSPRSAVLSSKFGGDNADELERTLSLELATMLDPRELNALFGDPRAWNRLYDQDFDFDAETGELHEDIEPAFPGLKAFELAKDFANAWVRIVFTDSVRGFIVYKDATLKKLRIKPQRGGQTALIVKIEGAPEPWDRRIPELLEYCGKRVQIELSTNNPAEQESLPFNRHGEGERDEQTAGEVA